MKVLIIGSGGREHAIAYGLNKSPRVDEIHAIPGNPGIAQIGTCHPGNSNNLTNIVGRRVWGFIGIEPVLHLHLRTADGWQRDDSDDNPFT